MWWIIDWVWVQGGGKGGRHDCVRLRAGASCLNAGWVGVCLYVCLSLVALSHTCVRRSKEVAGRVESQLKLVVGGRGVCGYREHKENGTCWRVCVCVCVCVFVSVCVCDDCMNGWAPAHSTRGAWLACLRNDT